MVNDLNDFLDDEDDLASFLNEEDDGNDLASFLAEEEEESMDLASFLAEEEEEAEEEMSLESFLEEEEEDDDLASFLAEEEEEDDLAAFLNEEDGEDDLAAFLREEGLEDDEDDLSAFLNDDMDKNAGFEGLMLDEEEDDDNASSILGTILGASNRKPEPLLPFKRERRKARLDITKNSKEDQRTIKRYTKAELQDQLKRDYKYMLAKSYMMIQPLTILADYPYKKKKSDSDIIADNNVDYDYALVIGKLLKWRSTEEFKGKPHKLGEIMYVRRGIYWVNGQEVDMKPHFAIVLKRSYKRIKTKRIRDMLSPLKQRLRAMKPFTIYKEFPIILKRTGSYS